MMPGRGSFCPPSPSELGIEVTIAIVAATHSGHFVHVSDRAISYDSINPTADNATVKNLRITRNWSVTYSTNDMKYVFPLINEVQSILYPNVNKFSADDIKAAFSQAYADLAGKEFMDRRLRRLGYNGL